MLESLMAHRGAIQKLVSSVVVLKRTPRLHFELDTSIEEGDRVLRLLTDLDPADGGAAPADSGPGAAERPAREGG